jgi:hypothetical protein
VKDEASTGGLLEDSTDDVDLEAVVFDEQDGKRRVVHVSRVSSEDKLMPL